MNAVFRRLSNGKPECLGVYRSLVETRVYREQHGQASRVCDAHRGGARHPLVRLWFTDVQGFLKSVSISPAELEVAFDEGMTFDGSAIDGYARVQEADMLARPDPSTFQVLPWRPEQQVARMYCDIVSPDGQSFEGDPRYVLKRNLERASRLGYTFYVAPELEFFYFKDSSPDPQVLDHGGYFDQTPLDVAQEYRRKTINALEQLGIPVEYSHHEVAPSQHEIDLRYTDALTMADNVMTFRLTVKEIALEHCIYATFMPKPLEAHDGSGFHMHLSLFEGDRNAFHEPGSPNGLSKVGESFIAGLCATPACYRGDQPVGELLQAAGGGLRGAIYVFWARNNQSALVRVPTIKKGKTSSTRVEYRAPDPHAIPTGLLGAAGRRAGRDREQLRAPPRTNRECLRDDGERAGCGRDRAPTRHAFPRHRRHGTVGVDGGGARRACLRMVPAEQAGRVGPLQHHVSRFELRTTSRSCEGLWISEYWVNAGPSKDTIWAHHIRPASKADSHECRGVAGRALPRLLKAMALAGFEPMPVIDLADADRDTVSEWEALVVELDDDAPLQLRTVLRVSQEFGVPVLIAAGRDHAMLLENVGAGIDFVLDPADPVEIRLRLRRIIRSEPADHVVHFKDLLLNTATYQATVADRPVDLTYMEYELLRFFVEHQGRVWSREQLLSKVWGYDYYGGARTVDVHVRRLRSKLGEERASWITTVRSVGYRFG